MRRDSRRFAEAGAPDGSPRAGRGSRAGFTLVEVMIAMIIIIIAVLALDGEMAVLSAYQIRATTQGEMTTFAETKLEELRSYAMLEAVNKDQVSLGGSLTTSEANHSDVITGPTGRQYTRRWLVEAGPAGTREVTLRVSVTSSTRHAPAAADFNSLLLVAP